MKKINPFDSPVKARGMPFDKLKALSSIEGLSLPALPVGRQALGRG